MTSDGPSRRKGRASAPPSDVPPAIQWQEGMLLAPQHFQWLSRRSESLLHYHAVAISPFHWGVHHLRVDPTQLVDGTFRVRELEAVMPDGLIVSRSPDDVPDLSIDLNQRAADMRQRPVTVHLAVARRGRGLALGERFAFEDAGPAADENTGEGEASVPILRPRLQLLLEDEPAAKYVSFPLARVVLGSEAFARTDYEPPWLRISPGSGLYERCEKASASLREKALFLSDQVRSPSTSARVPQLLETKAMIHSLVGGLPAFEAVLRCGVSHPFPLYVALCTLLGHVAGLGRTQVPSVLEPYDHNDLRATFEQALAQIERSVAEGIHEAYTSYRFAYDGGAFRIRFDPDWAARSLILGVRAPSGVPDSDMAAWMAASLIAAKPKITDLWDRRVPGARRTRIEVVTDLVPSQGVSLYSLSADPEFVVPGEELEIRNLDDRAGKRRPEEIVLYVRNRT